MFSIISNHIFSDGNKRTGLEAALLFLRLNNWHLRVGDLGQDEAIDGISLNDLYNFTIAVASGELDLDAVRAWFAAYASKR